MEGFTLDTSGEVRGARLIEMPDGNWRSHWTWDDLPLFAQGYIRAAFESLQGLRDEMRALYGPHPIHTDMPLGFRHLAPETLAAMLKDCERLADLHNMVGATAETGRFVWDSRQRRLLVGFPPVTLYLGDGGLIYQQRGEA